MSDADHSVIELPAGRKLVSGVGVRLVNGPGTCASGRGRVASAGAVALDEETLGELKRWLEA